MADLPAKFEVSTSNNLGEDALTRKNTFGLDLGVKDIQNDAKYSLHYVTYAPAKFGVATPNSLRKDAFTRKYNIRPLTLSPLLTLT